MNTFTGISGMEFWMVSMGPSRPYGTTAETATTSTFTIGSNIFDTEADGLLGYTFNDPVGDADNAADFEAIPWTGDLGSPAIVIGMGVILLGVKTNGGDTCYDYGC
jgi:hypothetical protein